MSIDNLSGNAIWEALNAPDPIEGTEIAIPVPNDPRRVVLGILCLDRDSENPLEDSDGLGHVYSAHRHASREDHAAMQEALGLDADWNQETQPNKYAVVLDVYDHGGTVYSLSGEGMQCAWDTSRGGAVWVPDACAREEIDRRAKVYTAGFILGPGQVRSAKWQAILDVPGHPQRNLGSFDQWHQAFDALKAAKKAGRFGRATSEQRAQALIRAKEEIARGCLETYNDWLAGSVYGIYYQAFALNAQGGLEEIDGADACWGIYGRDYAAQMLRDECTGRAQHLGQTPRRLTPADAPAYPS